jgi:hypothetical protein
MLEAKPADRQRELADRSAIRALVNGPYMSLTVSEQMAAAIVEDARAGDAAARRMIARAQARDHY